MKPMCGDFSNDKSARNFLDQLFAEARLYHQSRDYLELLEFVSRLRNFAPFNAMLLHVQKPGLRYAASAEDWSSRFNRRLKVGARPLIILWPFGPVALVYDVMDTEGPHLPADVTAFQAHGPITALEMRSFFSMLASKHVECHLVDHGDGNAGGIRILSRAKRADEFSEYQVLINKNHPPAVQFATLVHEIGHLCLGHLGMDKRFKAKDRRDIPHHQKELEAESLSYIVCARCGVFSKSHTYLADYVGEHATVEHIGLYEVMRAAGRVETLLRLTDYTGMPGL